VAPYPAPASGSMPPSHHHQPMRYPHGFGQGYGTDGPAPPGGPAAAPPPALERPTYESEQGRAMRVLAPYGLTLAPVRRDGDCFFTAFLQTARAAGVPRTDMSVAGLREILAQALLDPRWRAVVPAHVLRAAENAWVARQSVNGIINPSVLHADPWNAIADQVRRSGEWADEGGDLVPYLAAAWFGVRIQVVHPNGATELIGDAAAPVVVALYHPTNHWDGTAPHRPYGTGAYYADTSQSMINGLNELREDPALRAFATAKHLHWVGPSRSAYDADGNRLPEDRRACVNVAVVGVPPPHR
jgi:hypothetical protein